MHNFYGNKPRTCLLKHDMYVRCRLTDTFPFFCTAWNRNVYKHDDSCEHTLSGKRDFSCKTNAFYIHGLCLDVTLCITCILITQLIIYVQLYMKYKCALFVLWFVLDAIWQTSYFQSFNLSSIYLLYNHACPLSTFMSFWLCLPCE